MNKQQTQKREIDEFELLISNALRRNVEVVQPNKEWSVT